MHDLSNWQTIIVDDESDNLELIKLILEFHNAQVRTAKSGFECLELLSQVIPSLLLVDIVMPEMSGYDLINIIRNNKDWQHIPAIAVTAHSMDGDAERMLEAGFDGYIPKPITAVTLVDDIVQVKALAERHLHAGAHSSSTRLSDTGRV